MTRDDRNYMVLMFEQMNGKFDLLIDMMTLMYEHMQTLATKDELYRVEAKVDTLTHAVTETNREVRSHSQRLDRLEIHTGISPPKLQSA